MANVLVTGSSKGFGSLIVKSLLQKGHKVAATMRDVSGKNRDSASALKQAGAVPIDLDVTREASVKQGVGQAIESLGGLDIVVNNAGVGVLGIQETFTVDDWQKLFDVNVFGVQRVNRAVLPHMRKKKSGLLIHISSLLGRIVIPFYGPYNASKFALEALADNYRIELSGFGIESVLVEPGGYGTTFMDGLIRPSDAASIREYGSYAEAPEKSLQAFAEHFKGPQAPNPQWVADAVVQIIAAPRGKRPFRTTVDRLGMAAAIEPYNQQIETIQKNMYQAFGMADVLNLKM